MELWMAGCIFYDYMHHNREHHFGAIDDSTDAMHRVCTLSEIGLGVDQEWNKTFDIRCDMNLEMGEYIIMPNHFHAIVIIGENQYNMGRRFIRIQNYIINNPRNWVDDKFNKV